MLANGMGTLHAAVNEQQETVGMSLTGLSGDRKRQRLILDYMSIRSEYRQQGLGKELLRLLRDWAISKYHIEAIVIEVEAEDTEVNIERLSFWLSCGFVPTSYIHQYIWVPEPYRAMVLPLSPSYQIQGDGQGLFRDIISLHERAYRSTK